jgi:carbon monoxide dehydrogenase subunit G
MRIEGQFDVRLGQADVLAFFRDAGKVVGCLPGLEEVRSVEADGATVVVRVGVSFIRGPMTLRVRRVHDADGAVVYRGQGAVDLEAGVQADARGPDLTAVSWYVQAQVGGTLASLGAGLLEPVVRQNLREFAGNLQSALEARAG